MPLYRWNERQNWVVGKGKAMQVSIIADITLCNGNANYSQKRTVMSETGLPADTLVEYVGKQSRSRGSDYRNSLYRIVGTDDLLTIRHNDGPKDNISWDNVIITEGFFANSKEYAKKVGALSNKYNIPFKVCLALGDKEEVYPWLIYVLSDLSEVTIGTIRDLYSGIARRKAGLMEVLGEELYETIGINPMGQNNSKRIALFVAEKCEQWLKR